jgi:hypothetical protein
MRETQIRIQQIYFLGEQDGSPERELKEQLAALFGRAQWVRTAYLARVTYEKMGRVNVALCVRGQPGQGRVFAERVGSIFASIFGSHEHLDIIWLVPEQEAALMQVCQPFFQAG